MPDGERTQAYILSFYDQNLYLRRLSTFYQQTTTTNHNARETRNQLGLGEMSPSLITT